MSSQFSYELDERQIRLLMQDTELPFDPGAWQKFEESIQSEPKIQLSSFNPKINFAVSRSVIVPIVFIILIGGLSAMLFSFVDFKKKEETTRQPIVHESVKVKKNILKPIINPKPAIKATVPATVAVNPKTLPEEKIVLKPEQKSTVQPPIIVTQEPTLLKNTRAEQVTVSPKKNRKKRKIVAEELPTINASSTNLNSGDSEPELELK